MDFELPSSPTTAFAGIIVNGDEYVRCAKCGAGGCDLRVGGCGCTWHARCIPLNSRGALTACPQCSNPTDGLALFPMSFRAIDEAQKAAASLPASKQGFKNRGRKRKGGDDACLEEEASSYISERRTGRWTTEEMTYCDKLIDRFEAGSLPLEDDVKLNEFLAIMLKSQQSRLTKKMKYAKLSSRLFKRTSGCLSAQDARVFSNTEESFFNSVSDLRERAEIKFNLQKEWREQFSRVCATFGQPLDAALWLNSVEEMDRRASQAKNAARIARRKLMVGVALRTDVRNPDQGVFIEKTDSELLAGKDGIVDCVDLLSNVWPAAMDLGINSSLHPSDPFLVKVTSYLQRHSVPFEHIDLWVPSFVPGEGAFDNGMSACRLYYAGSATVGKLIAEDGKGTRPLTQEEQFNFSSFGDYSQKFSFDIGCGLPGRVYESGCPTWEQSVHNAPNHQFERCGGAHQWGIKTVTGIPVASPNVGRIVATLYSTFDRPKDEELVTRLSEEFTKLLPSPKWKLVVDVGDAEEAVQAPLACISDEATTLLLADSALDEAADLNLLANLNNSNHNSSVPLPSAAPPLAGTVDARDSRVDDVISLIGEYMPADASSPLSVCVSGLMSLRLLLLRPSHSREEEELVKTVLNSFSSYTGGGRDRSEIVVMLARDFTFLRQQQSQHQDQLQHNLQQLGQQRQQQLRKQQSQHQDQLQHSFQQLTQQQQQPQQLKKQESQQESQHQGQLRQNLQQPASFLGVGQGMVAASAEVPPGTGSGTGGLSLFQLPSTSSSLQNSPAPAPVPVPGSVDVLSIVSM